MNSNSKTVGIYKPKKILQGANLYLPNSMLLAELDASVSVNPINLEFCEIALKLLNESRPVAAKMNSDAMLPLPNALTNATTFAELVNYLALTLQRWCGLPVKFSKVLGSSKDAQVEHIVFECRLYHLATSAGQIAAEICLNGIKSDSVARERIKKMIAEFDRVFIGGRINQIAFIREAEKESIPWLPLTADGSILAFGQGSKLRKVHQNFTSTTSLIASKVATDKHTAANMLRAQGIPVPKQAVVNSGDAAIEASQRMGFPVVVKPARKDLGTAVFVDVQDKSEVSVQAAVSLVSIAFSEASKFGPVAVEQLIHGEQHRLMVINGKFRSARKKTPTHVIGDGVQTVLSLIEQANQTSFSNDWRPDDEAQSLLKKQDLNMDSVPVDGMLVQLRLHSDLTIDRAVEDVTSSIHPANVQLAERAAAIIDIDVAGLDFITSDITKPYWEVGAAFSEVNMPPGLIFNEEKIILSEWFPDDNKGRILTIVLLDPLPDKNRGVKIAKHLQSKYSKVCLAAKRGLYIDGDLMSPANFASHQGLQAALCEPGVNAVVLEIDADELVKNGLGIDCCDLSVFAAPPENGDQQATLTSRKLLESISACVLDNSIVREGANASLDAKKLAREINLNSR